MSHRLNSLLKPSSAFVAGKNYTLIGMKADDDYFTFTVDKEQVVKANLSAIPGSDTNISVYDLKYVNTGRNS